MPQPDSLAIAAACLPGTGGVELQQVGFGPFNDTFRARRGERQFTLRIARTVDAQGRGAREFEAQVVGQAAACDLAPPLVFSDAAGGVQVLDWLPGRPWEAGPVGDACHIEAAAGLIRRVHALSAPTPMRSDSPAGWVARYREALAVQGAPMSLPLSEAAARALGQLALVPAGTIVVCHSDLHRLNVLQRSHRDLAASVLLDWEYAHCSEPGWDLAAWSANNDFSAQQSRALLTAYAGMAPTQDQWRRFGLLRWLFDYVCLLWTRLYGEQLVGAAPAFATRTALLETRLNAAVCGKLPDHDGHYFLES